MSNLDVPFSGSTRSPQADLIDNLIWENLGSFWTDAYKPEDKDALSAVYESMLTVLDAEYVRLFEINQAKSVRDCPVFTQRRWLRLDMNKYDQVKAWLQFLRGGTAALTGQVPANVLDCAALPDISTRHWHLSFPWVIPDLSVDLRGLIDLSFPIGSIALVDVYKVYEGSDGIRRGLRLEPRTSASSVDWEVELLPDGHTIHILNPSVNEEYEFVVAFDFSSETYIGLRPRVFLVQNFLGPNVVQVPASMTIGLPVHALIVRNPPQIGTSGLETTNREDLDTERIFIPYGPTGVQLGTQGQITLPADFVLNTGDAVFVFGLEAGDFDTVHVHQRDTLTLEQSDLISGLIVNHTPGVQVPLGLFGSIDYLGQQLQLFINGQLIHPGDYRYEFGSNTFFFRKPIAGSNTGETYIDVLFTEETRSSTGPFHTHQQCFKGNIDVPKQFGTFDDGGTFDDQDTDPPGVFDDYDYDNTALINDIVLTADQIEVFVNGALLAPSQYTVTPEYKQTRITFSLAIEGKDILVSSIRNSMIYIYGLSDIIPSTAVYGISLDTLHNILNDLTNVVAQFEAFSGSQVSDLATLLEAAFIAAGGGNPLLALFYNEFKEYDGLPLDAPGQFLTAVEARTVESQNTQLIDIPFLVNDVLNPTVRLEGGGAQFQVVDGNIQSSVDLTADTITEQDAGTGIPVPANAGIWWCPLVLLDESMLAKNFGVLVGDVRPASSLQYKNALVSNLMLRYSGPTMQAITRTAAIMLGSEMFTQDSKIIGISPVTTAYNITITAVTSPDSPTSSSRQEIFVVSANAPLPQLGATVYPGQSIAYPVIVDLVLSQLESWTPGILTVNFNLAMIQKGDRARLAVYDPNDIRSVPVVVELNVVSVFVRSTLNGPQTVIQFDQAIKYIVTVNSWIRVFRDFGDPRAGFEGQVTDITASQDTLISTEYESFTLHPGQGIEWNIGDLVYRGDPVRPGLATAYDEVSRPGWNYVTLDQWRDRLEFSIQDSTFGFASSQPVQKYGSITVPDSAEKFGKATLSDLSYVPARGTFVTLIQDNTEAEFQFSVIGTDGNAILMTPPALTGMSGIFQFQSSIPSQKLDFQQEYFEVAPQRGPSLLSPTATQVYAQRAGSAAIEMSDLSTFPLKGRVNVLLPSGGSLEFEYFNHTDSKFLNCHWTTPFTALGGNSGSTTIDAAATFILVAEYRDSLINPAFTALVTRRATSNGTPVIVTDDNADELYELLRASTAVLELGSIQEPAILEATLAEVIPPGTSLEVIHKDVLIDEVIWNMNDTKVDYAAVTLTITAE